MAYKIIGQEFVRRVGRQTIYRITAVLDAPSDLEALGTDYPPGSIAIVADTGVPTYMMNASGMWKEV